MEHKSEPIRSYLSIFPYSTLESSARCGLNTINTFGQFGTGQQESPTLLAVEFDALLGKLRTRCCITVA